MSLQGGVTPCHLQSDLYLFIHVPTGPLGLALSSTSRDPLWVGMALASTTPVLASTGLEEPLVFGMALASKSPVLASANLEWPLQARMALASTNLEWPL